MNKRITTIKICTILLIAFAIAAIFCYQFALDNNTNADTQISELALHPCNTKISVLSIQPIDKLNEKSGFFTGSKEVFRCIPYTSKRIKGNEINLTHYNGINPFTREILPLDTLAILKSEATNRYVYETKFFPLGTDAMGRCLWSRLIIGTRISVLVGFLAAIISLIIGVTVGLLSGYYQGRVDAFLMYFVNVIWSIPTLLLVFAIVLALGRGISVVYLAVGLTLWVEVARLVRGQVKSFKEYIFVEAGTVLGYSHKRILFLHILPNLMGPILVLTASNFATAIILEAGLSYLGFGVQPPTPSWGNMLNENYGYALSGHYLPAILPAMAIILLVLTVNILGNALRDHYDVKLN